MHRTTLGFSPGARDVLAQVIQPTLHRQRWSLDGAQSGSMSRLVHLGAGRGELSHRDGEMPLREPDVVWLPAGTARSLRVEAGSAGVVVGVSDSLLAAALGDHADSAALRQMSSHLCRFAPHDGERREELWRSLLAIESEARAGAGASWHYLAAQLTIVLVVLWRMAGHGAVVSASARHADPRLRQFRHLVEAQFRQRWPIARYAAELAMSPDRLHDLSVRALGRPPLALVHQRLLREACLLLTGSELSVERLAGELGFAGASQFSHFFKRRLSVGPKAYREQSRALAAAGQPMLPSSYADWP